MSGDQEDGLERMATPVDSEDNPLIWMPECLDCADISCMICIPHVLTSELQLLYTEPKFWISQLPEAFFVATAHSVTQHHPKVKFCQTVQGTQHFVRMMFKRVTEEDVHYFVPFHDGSEAGHFFLLHFFNNDLYVSDCEVDASQHVSGKLQREVLSLLEPVAMGFREARGPDLKIHFTSNHILMRRQGDDQCHCGANVCANLILSLIPLLDSLNVPSEMKTMLERKMKKYRSCWGKQRRLIVIQLLHQFLPNRLEDDHMNDADSASLGDRVSGLSQEKEGLQVFGVEGFPTEGLVTPSVTLPATGLAKNQIQEESTVPCKSKERLSIESESEESVGMYKRPQKIQWTRVIECSDSEESATSNKSSCKEVSSVLEKLSSPTRHACATSLDKLPSSISLPRHVQTETASSLPSEAAKSISVLSSTVSTITCSDKIPSSISSPTHVKTGCAQKIPVLSPSATAFNVPSNSEKLNVPSNSGKMPCVISSDPARSPAATIANNPSESVKLPSFCSSVTSELSGMAKNVSMTSEAGRISTGSACRIYGSHSTGQKHVLDDVGISETNERPVGNPHVSTGNISTRTASSLGTTREDFTSWVDQRLNDGTPDNEDAMLREVSRRLHTKREEYFAFGPGKDRFGGRNDKGE